MSHSGCIFGWSLWIDLWQDFQAAAWCGNDTHHLPDFEVMAMVSENAGTLTAAQRVIAGSGNQGFRLGDGEPLGAALGARRRMSLHLWSWRTAYQLQPPSEHMASRSGSVPAACSIRIRYPRDNIIYSDDHTAVLIQNGHEVARVPMDDTDHLYGLLVSFFAHERQEIADFNKAVRQFAQDLPAVLQALRELIAEKRAASRDFAKAEVDFLKHAQEAINPAVSEEDVQEMLIQHILTEDIFAKVFDNPDFHRQNNVASELYKLEERLFERGEKSTLLRALAPYYSGIASTAAVISTHSEKQGFLKGLYENFYKVYNPKAADKLGVVYTPGEIVRFMIRSADWLCEKHFGKNLIDRGVEILDPATGTGTFIVELLESFRGHGEKLRHKYKEELHANEIAILPYYVANLNIEATYQAITGQFAEFENLCFVDTLDNIAALGKHAGQMDDMFGGTSDENMARIKRQNERPISVIIGNPPYNAWQSDFSARNPNRPYKRVDERVRQTYRARSGAQNTIALSDMYVRFWRWATDRLKTDGVIAFVTNRNFIEKLAFDGFRKSVRDEFSDIWLMDLGGDVRANPKLSGTMHNVFGIQTGVTIAFFVKREGLSTNFVNYARRPENERASDKLAFLGASSLNDVRFEQLKPDAGGNWLEHGRDEWSDYLPIADPTKSTDLKTQKIQISQGEHAEGGQGAVVEALFRLSSNGVTTQRDEWVWDWKSDDLLKKVSYLVNSYEEGRIRKAEPKDIPIKWDDDLERNFRDGLSLSLEESHVFLSGYRPFVPKWLYVDPSLNGRLYRLPSMYRNGDRNPSIAFRSIASEDELTALAFSYLVDAGFVKTGNGRTFELSRYRYANTGDRVDNITDWGLNQFIKYYGKNGITKDEIFAYCYAVLYDPIYREKYALNLKREFPRIPFYPDFARWAAWGEALKDMHIGYEAVEPWPVERIETPAKRAAGTHPKPVLKSQSDKGCVVIDADTQITGIPLEAWNYRLGNRSAIDWVLDQHKEKKPRDPTIAAKFNTYRFADYKESMIGLLAKVVRVSVDTVAITEAMKALDRSDWRDASGS